MTPKTFLTDLSELSEQQRHAFDQEFDRAEKEGARLVRRKDAYRSLIEAAYKAVASEARLRAAFTGSVAELDAALIAKGTDMDALTAACHELTRVKNER